MAYDDKSLGSLFPTRTGEATGTANERQMLDAVNDTAGFRTRLQENGDGSTTRLRTRGGFPEFVTNRVQTETTEVELPEMDSGAIDLVATAPAHPKLYDDGILHYGSIQRAYYALKKLLGKIKIPSLLSDVPPVELAAPSSYKVSLNSLGVRNPDMLGLLYLKKVATAYVPASLFCGKARLYAQAQYGAPLKYWNWSPTLDSGEVPQLQYKGDSRRAITTFSGIYLDGNRTHWLLSMDNLGVRITKLVRDASVEKLVKQLGGADNDKIEAYILSRSYPSDTMTFWIAVPGTPGCNSMGYGWKFNWSGTACDIVTHRPVDIATNVTYFDAYHYRIAFSRNDSMGTLAGLSAVDAEKARWSAALSLIEGPIRWHNNYTGECIALPLWGEYVLEKFGSKLGDSIGTAAPIYCFYKRNTLEVIRFTANGGESQVRYKRTSEPASWMGVHDWSTTLAPSGDLGTVGLGGGAGEALMRTHTPFTAGFYSSDAYAVPTTSSFTSTRRTISDKAFNSVIDWTSSGVSNPQYHHDITAADSGPTFAGTNPDGVPYYYSSAVITDTTGAYLGNGTSDSANIVSLSYTREDLSVTHSEGADVVLVIPFHDAEAVYLWAKTSTTETITGNGGGCTALTAALAFYRPIKIYMFADGEWSVVDTYAELHGAGSSFLDSAPATPINRTDTTYNTVCSKLITSGGTFDFTPPESMGPFQDGGADAVEQPYFTQFSVLGAGIGHGAKNLMGYSDFSDPVPFIGWA